MRENTPCNLAAEEIKLLSVGRGANLGILVTGAAKTAVRFSFTVPCVVLTTRCWASAPRRRRSSDKLGCSIRAIIVKYADGAGRLCRTEHRAATGNNGGGNIPAKFAVAVGAKAAERSELRVVTTAIPHVADQGAERCFGAC